ncbi:MAG: GNAT family N-acetyltransferase [Acidimicrobiia bacterium]
MSRFVSEQLTRLHKPSDFRCGVEVLDRWLVDHAAHAQSMRTAQTFVWHRGDHRVVAYFSLAAHLLVRANLPRQVGRGSPASIPAVLLARLALDTSLHGGGLGAELLWDALHRARTASAIAAARLVVVDAINTRAGAFYQHHGFRPIPDNSNRLVQKMSDIAAALDHQRS